MIYVKKKVFAIMGWTVFRDGQQRALRDWAAWARLLGLARERHAAGLAPEAHAAGLVREAHTAGSAREAPGMEWQ